MALDLLSETGRSGFVWGLPIFSDSPFLYLLCCYQAERPLDAWQAQRVSALGEIAKLVLQAQGRWLKAPVKTPWTDWPRAWQGEERARQEIASVLHGPVQTKLLILEKQVHDIREQWRGGDLEPLVRALIEVETGLEHLREDDIRRLSHRLYPDLIQVSLGAALRGLRQDFDRLIPVEVSCSPAFLEIDAPIDNQIPELTRVAIYRIVEEAVNNAIRHGQAHHMRVTLDALQDQTLQIDIVDDGSGFSPTVTAGFGLRLMTRWAQRVGGRIAVLPHTGGHVQLLVPLRMLVATGAAARED